jgi:5'-nucleotidase
MKLNKVLLLLVFGLAQPAAQAAGECAVVVVKKGDSLAKIAAEYFGDAAEYPRIIEATRAKAALDKSYARLRDPNVIPIGAKLCVPDVCVRQPKPSEASAAPAPAGDGKVSFILLQVNDVYEITPVNGAGGLARLASLKKQLLAENPNTFMVLAGDLFSPSALGTAKVDGTRLSGKQIVDGMNLAGLDFATFGNHEFDLNEAAFLQRMQETKARWISSNVTDAQGQPFANSQVNYLLQVTDQQQESAKIGFFGVTLPSNPKDYVKYSDPLLTAAQQVAELDPQADVLVAITHLAVEQDKTLAARQPQVDLILGGHEHENMRVETGAGNPVIYKADANARTAYIHRVSYDLGSREAEIQSELKHLNPEIPDDAAVAQNVSQWLNIAHGGFRQDGFEPEAVVANAGVALDGLESSVRNRPTQLTDLILHSFLSAMPEAELALFNGGMIRIDDVLAAGPLTEYDIIRIMPFGGNLVLVEMKGSLLRQVLDAGRDNAGKGGYLQAAHVSSGDKGWEINHQPLEADRAYRVALNNFLLTGQEQGIGFLSRDNPELKVMAEGGDLRKALIAELKKRYPARE